MTSKLRRSPTLSEFLSIYAHEREPKRPSAESIRRLVETAKRDWAAYEAEQQSKPLTFLIEAAHDADIEEKKKELANQQRAAITQAAASILATQPKQSVEEMRAKRSQEVAFANYIQSGGRDLQAYKRRLTTPPSNNGTSS